MQQHPMNNKVLVLKAADGSETRMQISEGLACSFQQHAAVIDIDNSNFVSLGSVGKKMVVTPNLEAYGI